jgi:hypothetical protein
MIQVPLEWIEGTGGLIKGIDSFEFVIGVSSKHRGTTHWAKFILVIVVIGHHIFYFYLL